MGEFSDNFCRQKRTQKVEKERGHWTEKEFGKQKKEVKLHFLYDLANVCQSDIGFTAFEMVLELTHWTIGKRINSSIKKFFLKSIL